MVKVSWQRHNRRNLDQTRAPQYLRPLYLLKDLMSPTEINSTIFYKNGQKQGEQLKFGTFPARSLTQVLAKIVSEGRLLISSTILVLGSRLALLGGTGKSRVGPSVLSVYNSSANPWHRYLCPPP